MASASLAKSSTAVSFFSRCVRFSRESVCTAFTPPSFLSTYIVCKSGWSNPVWNLLATMRKRYSGSSNILAVWRSEKRVHPGLGVGLSSVRDAARKGHQRLEGITAFMEVAVHGELVPYGVQSRACHDHGLGLAADPVLHLGGEVLDHDPDLLVDGVGVQLDEGA